MQDTITRIHPAQRWSQIVIHGNTVYLCGQVAQGAPNGTIAEQTTDILARIDALLAEAGSSKERILSATIWLTDIDRIAEMNAVWDAWVPQGAAPARACVEARLSAPRFNVELSIVAAR